MKLTLKIYQQPDSDFQIDAEPSETIGDLKAKIKESKGYNVEVQNIIFLGSGLDNDRTLESCRIKESGFLVLSITKPPGPLPIPRELDAAEYFSLSEDEVAEWLGALPLSKIATSDSTPSGSTFKYDPTALSGFDSEIALGDMPPITTVSTFKYRPLLSPSLDSDASSETVPPVTTVSTFKYRPFKSSSMLDTDTTFDSLPPVTTVSTFKYRPFKSSSMLDTDSTSEPVPPVTTVSTFKYRPFQSSSIIDSDTNTASTPPITTVSTFKYRPLSSSMLSSDTTSAHVPPVTTVSTFKYRPLSSIGSSSASTSAFASGSSGVPASTSTHIPASVYYSGQTMSQQAGILGTGMNPGPGSSSSGDASGGRIDPRIAQFRELVTNNPELRQHFIQQLAQQNPELGQVLTQNPDMLLRFLDRMESGQTVTPSLTEAERGAIERLEALGFPKQPVIEAYFACDKNEELAANYLLENA